MHVTGSQVLKTTEKCVGNKSSFQIVSPQVSREDDEMYSDFDGPLPQCNIKNRIVV